VVERAAIPSKQAEAEAAERRARAVARRRLATGAAIAVAAVGIGLGIRLGLWKPPYEEKIVSLPPAQSLSPVERVTPIQQRAEPVPNRPTPAEPKPFDPHQIVVDYDKFATRSAFVGGRLWQVEAGHHYATDTDTVWESAWCYTSQSADGVLVKIDLAARDSPGSTPLGPLASPESLIRVGLDDSSALDLAAKCPWLDGREYQGSDFAVPPGRTQRPAPQYVPASAPQYVPAPAIQPEPAPASPPAPIYIARDGFDLPGNDLANMPINSDTQSDCEASCDTAGSCVAYVFNKPFKKCFLKSSAGTILSNDQAYTGYKNIDGIQPRVSMLQTHKQISLIGTFYRKLDNIKYGDCTLECDKDSICLGFNYDSSTKGCVMLKEINNTIPMPTVSSGRKSSAQ
jgi:PAN domain-containing protein